MQAWPSAPTSAKAASGLTLFSLGNTTLLFLHTAQEEAFKQLLKHLLLALLGSCPEIPIIIQEHGCGVLHTHKSQFYLQIADAHEQLHRHLVNHLPSAVPTLEEQGH